MSNNDSPGERISPREIGAVIVVAVVTTIVMMWPLALQIDEILPGMGKIGDPYLNAWQVAWQAHALETDPAGFFQGNTHWPEEDSLAFIDTTAGYTLAGLVGDGLDAAVVRFNTLHLFTYVLAFVAAYLLARQLGLGIGGAFVAAAAFAFAPWRSAQNGHLVVLSSGGIPLSLFFLLRGYRKRLPWMVIVGGAVAAWQLSVGFTLGLQFVYLLGGLTALFALRVWRGVEPRPSKRFLAAVAVAAGTVLVVGGALAIPFLRVVDRYPEAADRFSELSLYSPPPSGFLVAPEYNLLWGNAADGLRRDLKWPEEQTLFPGLATVSLGAVGALSRSLSRNVRLFLLILAGCTAVLSMGVSWAPSKVVYSVLYEIAPGWQGIRTPGRLNTTTSLCLALLAGAGATTLLGRLGDSARSRLKIVLAVALTFLVLLEGRGSIWPGRPLPAPRGLETAQAPLLHLPFDEISDRIYTFWSIDGFPQMVNGVGAVVVPDLQRLRKEMEAFPDPSTVERLRDLGVETVVLHPQLAPETPWEDTATVAVSDLGITSRTVGEVILFDLNP